MKNFVTSIMAVCTAMIFSVSYGQELPEVIPPSPTVANLMQFEEVPVSYYTGQPNISIPIYSKALNGDLAVNIGLSYNTQGVKINNRSGWVGTSWSLNAGGVISRTVRGIPDELVKNSATITGEGVLHIDDFWDYETISTSDQQRFRWRAGGTPDDAYDHQSDLFQFNVLGLTGRFILVRDGNGIKPKLLSKNQNIKIDIDYHATTYELNKFIITDTKGYVYTFDVKEETNTQPAIAIELYDNETADLNGLNQDYISTTAWHLSSIEMPNSVNGNLSLATFTYALNQETYTASITRTDTRPINPPQPTWNDRIGIGYNASVMKPRKSYSYLTLGVGTQKLSRIDFNDGTYVEFDSPTIAELEHPEIQDGKVLKYIRIKGPNNSTGKHYEFVYEDENNANGISTDRLWLEKIKEFDINGVTSNDYLLEYNDRDNLATFDDVSATDDWGYNKIVNSSSCGVDIPDTDAVLKGLLSRIIYPTGGSKEFTFEPHKITYQGNSELSVAEYRDKNPDNWFFTGPNNDDLSDKHAPYYNSFGTPNPSAPFFVLTEEQEVTYTRGAVSGADVNNTSVQIWDANNNVIQAFNLDELTQVKFTLAAGTYYIHYITPSSPADVTANICIGYKRFLPTVKKYIYGGGVRIQSIAFKDDPLIQNDEKKVNFSYDDILDSNKSTGAIDGSITGLIKKHTESVSRHWLQESCPISVNPTLDLVTVNFEVITRSPNVELTQGQYVGYKTVEVSEQNNGSTRHTFTSPQDYYSPAATFVYPYPPADDIDYMRGLLLKTEVLNELGDPLKETINTYDFEEEVIARTYQLESVDCQWKQFYDFYDDYVAVTPNKLLQQCASSTTGLSGGVFVINLDNLKTSSSTYVSVSGCGVECMGAGNYSNCGSVPYIFHPNDIKSTWAKLISTETKDYFYDGGPTNIKESRQEYVYDATNYQIDSLKVFYNEKGIEQQLLTEYFYPHDNVSSTSAALRAKLINNVNKVNEVLETITSKNGVKLSQANTEYFEFETDLILPKVVETQKGTGATEARIEFYDYDAFGNPLEVGKTDGIKIAYVWGFDRTVPLAKVINTPYSAIEALPSFGTGFNLTGNLSTQQVSDLRGLSNTMVSTFTYDPIVGITSQQDDRGYLMSYVYDDFNRLKQVKDQEGYILSENEYLYSPQSSYVKTTGFKVPTLDGLTNALSNATLIDDNKIESITHFDGIGRAKQSIVKQAGGNKQHIVIPMFYDDYSRQVEEYLPMQSVVTGATALDYIDNDVLKSNQKTHYYNKYSGEWANVSDVNAFSETHFENSPLNRVLEQGAPGEDWKVDTGLNTDHTIKFDYQTNVASEVRLFEVNFLNANTETPELTYSGYYSANELFKTITKDENWQPSQTHTKSHTTEEFTNSMGQVVLKRTYDNGIVHDTYYVYDDFGNLTYVLSPEGSSNILDINNNIDQTVLDIFCYQYRYDHRNRLTEKKIPQKGWEYIVYDTLDRPILTQDANLRATNDWLFTKYDRFDRVAYTGKHHFVPAGSNDNSGRTELQSNINGQSSFEETRLVNSITVNGTLMYYSNTRIPHINVDVLTINYYDDYNWDTSNGFQASYNLNTSGGLQESGNLVTKTTANGILEGFTTDSFTGDGFIAWTIVDPNRTVSVGLSETTSAPNHSSGTIDFCLYVKGSNKRIYIKEDGPQQLYPYKFAEAGDRFKVERSGDYILYKINEETIHTSLAPASHIAMLGDSSFSGQGVSISNVHIGHSSLGQAISFDTNGLATGSKVRILDTNLWTSNVTYYDDKARVIHTTSDNKYLDTKDAMSSKLDFTGNPIQVHTTHQSGSASPIVTIDDFTYDHANRLIRQEQCVNNENKELIARQVYDEFGTLEQKLVGGTLPELSTYVGNTGLTVTGNLISKPTGSAGWNAGLSTQETISGDGYVSFTAPQNYKIAVVGLSYTDTNVHFNSINYAIYIRHNGDAWVYENGTYKNANTYHGIGDEFRVERRGTIIHYLKNGTIFYTSTMPTTSGSMLGDVSLYTVGAEVKDLVLVDLDSELQEVDFTYNVRGWLTKINDVDNLNNGSANDLFGFKLNYNSKDLAGSEQLYNGNISETYWNTASTDPSTLETSIKRGYSYSYDALNRIKAADFLKTSGADHDNYFNLANVNYDKNGNITTLKRSGMNSAGVLVSDMDDLAYSYDGNQLKDVEEIGSNTEGFTQASVQNGDYLYDANGNMIEDKNKKITSIVYNHLNLPTEVVFDNSSTKKIDYIYDATGLKLKKVVHDNGNTTTTEYAGNYIYENSVLKFFSHPEGYIEPNGANFDYVYQYKDHLGNIRLAYADNDDSGTVDTTEIIEENNYYPFGLKQKGYNVVVSSNSNSMASKYKYNGKELNKELGLDWYDFGFRNYDAVLGRWMNIDPLAENYYSYSAYSSMMNNPVSFIDPDGRFTVDIKGNKSEEALAELQASVGTELNLSMKDGRLSYTLVDPDATLSKDAQKLVNAINDANVRVNITATDRDFDSTDTGVSIGSFMGNEMIGGFSPPPVDSELQGNGIINQVETFQEINVPALSEMSKLNKKPGQDTLHEVTESYLAGKLVQSNGKATGFGALRSGDTSYAGAIYLLAHNPDSAAPQSGRIKTLYFDKNGTRLNIENFVEFVRINEARYYTGPNQDQLFHIVKLNDN